MLRYVIRRILIAIPMLLFITVLIFFLVDAMPGDVVNALVGGDEALSEDAMNTLRESMGLNENIFVRYFKWVKNLFMGDFGESLITHEDVLKMIRLRMGPTLKLMGISLVISIVVGVLLGIVSARHPYSILDYFMTFFVFLGRSVPVFFIAIILIYFFALKNPLLPVGGISTIGVSSTKDQILHLILPVSSLGILRTTEFLRYTRASFLEVSKSDFTWTARSKGINEGRVNYVHVLRNSLIPIITLIGLNIPVLFSGAMVIEQIFQWPGLGTLFYTAVIQRDINLLMGLCFISSAIVLISNLLTDIAYAVVDPRIRYK